MKNYLLIFFIISIISQLGGIKFPWSIVMGATFAIGTWIESQRAKLMKRKQ